MICAFCKINDFFFNFASVMQYVVAGTNLSVKMWDSGSVFPRSSNSVKCSLSLCCRKKSPNFQLTSTGKELDAETGYSYFGARYYAPTSLATWLSVDPMSDKYPSISPYAYCAWTRPTGGHEHLLIKFDLVNNPLRIVDPNGDSLRIDGTDAQKQKVLEYMHQYSHLTFQCDDNGYVSLNTSLSGSEIQTRTDLYINEMIGNPENISIIKIVESNYVEEKGIYMQDNNPTLYGGTSNLNRDDNGIINRVEGFQYLNLNMLGSVCGNDSESKNILG